MDTNKYILWCSVWISVLIGGNAILLVYHTESQVTSPPVEEMYHRQLVTTIDSILDARHNEEVIDSDDVSIPSSMFSSRNSINIAK